MQPFLMHAAGGPRHWRGFRVSQRAGVAAAAFCMQLALGAVYGWSVFLGPLQNEFGAGRAAVNLTFTITLAVLGLTAGFGGSLQRRIGPRATATLAGVLYGFGHPCSPASRLICRALYVTHGVLGGIGLGLGYIVPLAVLIRWFPDRHGFISGLAVAGFGLGALITSPLATALIAAYGVQNTLMLARRRLLHRGRVGGAGAAARRRRTMSRRVRRRRPARPSASAPADDAGAGAAHAPLASAVVDAGDQRQRRRGPDLRRRAVDAGLAQVGPPGARVRCASSHCSTVSVACSGARCPTRSAVPARSSRCS